jgi:molybdopterin converting factor small subunit
MVLKILYFASLRETLGQGSEQLELPPGVTDVASLRCFLAARGDQWQAAGVRSGTCAARSIRKWRALIRRSGLVTKWLSFHR